jgi:hypothetical protein
MGIPVNPRTASRLAWSLCAISVALSLGGAVLAVVSSRTVPAEAQGPVTMALILPPIALLWAVMGALVASRRPGNQISWFYCAIGLGVALLGASAGYFGYALYGPLAPLPGGRFAAWATTVLFVPSVYIGPVSLLFVFPDGHFLSTRWRLVFLTLIPLGLYFGGLSVALQPGLLEGLGVTNPVGVGGGVARAMRLLDETVGAVLPPVAFLSANLAMILRYRRASGVERQQLKWVAYVVISALMTFVMVALAPVPTPSVFLGGGGPADLSGAFFLVLMPVCTGVAILRYRLYEIDRVINRTLVYASLTICLALVYLASVLVLGQVLNTVTGGSGLAVAVSTLAVAAAFGPARARIQRLVDRRFFRHKYDAARTLEGFGARVREEVSLDELSRELRAVVADTMQPTHVSLWLRGTRRRSPIGGTLR